jgi:hypothetical protein
MTFMTPQNRGAWRDAYIINVISAAIFIIIVAYGISFVIRVIRINEKMVSDMRQSVSCSVLLKIANACDDYKTFNGRWPKSLSELQTGPPSCASASWTDGWGRTVIFVPYSHALGYGKVISYGRDGKPGGIGLDGDIEIRYPIAINTNWDTQQSKAIKGY